MVEGKSREFWYDFLMRKVLNKRFFERPTERVAKELLGKFLVRRLGQREIALMITEVEIYDGFKDRASHASRGKTKRNEIMFGSAGRWYVYFTYGMHWMLNVVTQRRNYPAAILVRSVRSTDGKVRLSGPAKLTKFLKIDRKLNGLPANKTSGLWIEDRNGIMNNELRIMSGPRVGVNYAGPYWSRRKWRFWISS